MFKPGLVFGFETFDIADHCRLESLEENLGPFDVFDLRGLMHS